ncbi:sugar kinase [Streptomyces sp. NPDC046915]|uniref:sugar kinase n=1 Tax=Streptomyces sp. NPDC046915 TaxID=3155257 RepID=UPI0033ED2185
MTVDVITYGETMGLFESERIGPLRMGGSMRLSMAGAETTVAIGVTRLGGSAAWVGVVGDDEVGRLILRTLRAEQVNTEGVVIDPEAPTGLLLKERRSADVSRVSYYRRHSAGARLAPEHVLPEHVTQARILHLSGITPALSESARAAVFRALELAAQAGRTTCVDLNYRSALWTPMEARPILMELIKRADIVLATQKEAAILTNLPMADPFEAATSLGRLGPRLVVVKRGAEGAVAWDDGRLHEVPPRPAHLLDPVGAGDSFAAGLLVDVARGRTPQEALETAATVAAVNVACPGDWEGLPSRAEVDMLRGDDVLR